MLSDEWVSQMRVTLMGYTIISHEGWNWLRENAPKLYTREQDRQRKDFPGLSDVFSIADDGGLLAEIGGRLCYLSWDMPNERTATNQGYLHNIQAQGHWSVLEHANYTFMIEGVSRRLTHELVRHRMLSPSQVSQRYVDHTEMPVILPPLIRDNPNHFQGIIAQHRALTGLSRQVYQSTYDAVFEYLTLDLDSNSGRKIQKTARDAAAYALTEATVASIQVTANGRTWLEFLAKRDSNHAADEIHELAKKINTSLREATPNIFGVPNEA